MLSVKNAKLRDANNIGVDLLTNLYCSMVVLEFQAVSLAGIRLCLQNHGLQTCPVLVGVNQC